MKILWLCIWLAEVAAAEDKAMGAEERYELGQKHLKRGYYAKAIEEFNHIRNYYRDDPMAIEAELSIADVYFKQSEWDQARLSYDEFRRRHPRHHRMDYVEYQLGLTLFKKASRIASRDQTWSQQALGFWAPFPKRHPDSEYLQDVVDSIEECEDRLAEKELLIAEFYARRDAWESVRRRSEGLLSVYPESPQAKEALALLVEAQTMLGNAPQAVQTLDRLAAVDSDMASKLAQRLQRRGFEIAAIESTGE
jgi:outer membrane protein assembly factor BamD